MSHQQDLENNTAFNWYFAYYPLKILTITSLKLSQAPNFNVFMKTPICYTNKELRPNFKTFFLKCVYFNFLSSRAARS